MNAFLNPSVAVLAKLGSIAVHVDEFLGSDGHHFDKIALDGLLQDPEIKTFIEAGRTMAMLPEKRSK